MPWDNEYQRHKHLWGKGPSELAFHTANYLRRSPSYQKMISIIDIGCGYGRDALYLSRHIQCTILGIDNSQEAIRMALDSCPKKDKGEIQFQYYDFLHLSIDNRYDVVFASNLYQLLRPEERAKFREIVRTILNPEGLLFMSTLSTSDSEHYGKGTPVMGELNSFIDVKYLHLCTREELEKDFGFLTVKELLEHEYDEPRATGETHHHISWLLVGQYLDNISAIGESI